MKFYLLRQYFPLAVLAIVVLSSCKPEKDSYTTVMNRQILSIMKEDYLWYKELPPLAPEAYPDPYEFLADLRYKPLDKWSFLMTMAEYENYFVKGEMIGHGIILGEDLTGTAAVRIAMVYPYTTAWNKGVRRGWELKKINSQMVTIANVYQLLGPSVRGDINTIEFINEHNESVTLDLPKEKLNIRSVVYADIVHYENKKIGYVVFQDFIATAKAEIDSIFTLFRDEEIQYLIIDFRYNGGGSIDIAIHLSSWIAGTENMGKPLINMLHNDQNSNHNITYGLDSITSPLSINRVVVLSTKSTASASELVTIGLKPYLEVTLAGSATSGKPVGMYGYPVNRNQHIVFPITFKFTNALNEGDFYEGLPVDIEAKDDISRDFGNKNEAMYNAALKYLMPGFITKSAGNTKASTGNLITPKTAISRYNRAF